MAAINKRKLVRAAVRARERAVAPYSKFKVGAALLTQTGEIIGGANVESASYGLTCCAERVALFNALTAGKRNFVAVAVVARTAGGADAVWRLPAIAGRVRAQGEGVRRGQPGADCHQRLFRPGTFARRVRPQTVVSS